MKNTKSRADVKVLGVFEGECADAKITNANGLDIPPEVWSTVFASDLYKQAIELGWYIGFLGHPEDPNCMDFEHACIVMTEGHIDDDGKVYGKFNLIDTPVGRIVKSFIDAGVTFGISVRGAGDIIDNSVDPDTFVFRGFDLVTFPAYPESIPTFSEIAASTDLSKRAKYQAVCAAVRSNVDRLDSAESIRIIQSQFAPQSEEYKVLQKRRQVVEDAENGITETPEDSIIADKLRCMTDLYLEQVEANQQQTADIRKLQKAVTAAKSSAARKLRSVERIMSAQLADSEQETRRIMGKYRTVLAANTRLKSTIEQTNLKYKQKIESATSLLQSKDATISDLQTELAETVSSVTATQHQTSNLGAINSRLSAEVKAARQLVEEYQDAYAQLYANALGADLGAIRITATTTVAELQAAIGGTSTANLSTTVLEPTPIDIVDDSDDPNDIITI